MPERREPPPAARNASAGPAVLGAAALSLGLYLLQARWPVFRLLAWPLVWLGTLAHELGHAVAARALGQEVLGVELYVHGSGLAQHQGHASPAQSALISAAGLLGPPLVGLAAFLVVGRGVGTRLALGAAAVGLAAALGAWIRQPFPAAFVALLVVALGALALRAERRTVDLATAFLGIQLGLSTFSRMDYLFAAEAHTGAGTFPSDTANLAAALGLPAWLCGAALAVASIALVALGARRAVRLAG